MPIIYKLVGIKNETINNEMLHPNWDNSKDSINIQVVIELFKSLGFSNDVLELKFITDSQTMAHEKDYLINEQESRIISLGIFLIFLSPSNNFPLFIK